MMMDAKITVVQWPFLLHTSNWGGRNDAQLHAVRFQQVDIPASAEISDAYIEFYAHGKSPAAEIDIRVELGTPLTYSTVSNNISARTYTSNKVKWETTEIITDYYLLRTPNLKNIIDENRLRGCKSESALSFLFTGLSHNNGTSVRSYEGGELYRPRLIITYINNGGGPSVDGAQTDLDKIAEVYINEISSQGSLSQKEDWIELYNNNDNDVVISGGIFISNKNDNKKLHELKNIFIPAKGIITLIADKKTRKVTTTYLSISRIVVVQSTCQKLTVIALLPLTKSLTQKSLINTVMVDSQMVWESSCYLFHHLMTPITFSDNTTSTLH
ncbi:hypothetical protein ACTVLL_25840 [Serratia nevei]|uniref:hypothetical protein n=1 Tax=Serratia nevei TaxID=2703794 RepID=UPI003FA6F32A